MASTSSGWTTVTVHCLLFFFFFLKSVRKLQLQNAAVKVLSRTKRTALLFSVLKFSQRLPIKHRIDFKALLLAFKSLDSVGLKNLSDLIVVHKSSRAQKSAEAISWENQESELRWRAKFILSATILHPDGTSCLMNSHVCHTYIFKTRFIPFGVMGLLEPIPTIVTKTVWTEYHHRARPSQLSIF